MPPTDDELMGLMLRYSQGENLSKKQMKVLRDYWASAPGLDKLEERLKDKDWIQSELEKMRPAPAEEIWESVRKHFPKPEETETPKPLQPAPLRPIINWRSRLLKAAAILIPAAIATWLIVGKHKPEATVQQNESLPLAIAMPAIPSDSSARLASNDGSMLNFDSIPDNATVSSQSGVIVKKVTAELLACYLERDLPEDDQQTVSTKTPIRGNTIWLALLVGQKRKPLYLRMQDGTIVLIKGGSSLGRPFDDRTASYPFNGTANFEVKKGQMLPFVVITPDGSNVRVTGTTFQVLVEKEKPQTDVDLFEGQLVLSNNKGTGRLEKHGSATMRPDTVTVGPLKDNASRLQWMTPYRGFRFDNKPFKQALAEVAQWYGCKVIYQGEQLDGGNIDDQIPRTRDTALAISKLGELQPQLHLELKGRRIIVSKR